MRPDLRILCPEPQNYSERGLAAAAELGQLDAAVLSQREFEARACHYDAFMVRLLTRVTREVISTCPRLRAIITPTTGLDHIDLDAAQDRNIKILSLRGEADFLATVTSTAEHTWALLLCVMRRIIPAQESVKENSWRQHPWRSRELSGRTLGIVGLGRLGTIVANYGRAFGMRVLAYDPFTPANPEGVTRFDTLDRMLSETNILTVHVPLKADTIDLISTRELALLPPGAYLINTSRGLIVNENALLSALESGHLAGAAVDVLTNEPSVPEGRHSMVAYARNHANLIITPHIAGASEDAIEKTDLFIVGKFRMWLTTMQEPVQL